jgi:hypothetical protein
MAQRRQGIAIQAGEDGHGQQFRAAPGQAVVPHGLHGGLQHGGAPLDMDVHQPRIQLQHRLQGPANRGGDGVQLQVQEDGALFLQLADEGRPLGAKQLQPHLEHAHAAR